MNKRLYRGYCKLPIDAIAPALEYIKALRGPIMSIVEKTPVAGEADTASRVRYIGYFFKEAQNTDKLLRQFDGACVGPR